MSWLNKLIDWVEDLFDGDDDKSSSSSNKNKASATNSTKKTTVENAITNPYGQASAKANQQAKQQEQNRNDAAYKNNTTTSNKTTSNKTTSTTTSNKTTSNTSNKTSASNNKTTSTTPSSSTVDKIVDQYQQEINNYKNQLEELLNPKILSALEVANILGVDYNEANILKDYNKATNDYYDLAVKELQDIRSDYDKNNTQYLNQIMNSYLDSTKHAAPTATGKGALAANALSTLLSASQSSALGDYDILQDINATNEARKKDIANNANLARQQFNDLGLALSNLSTTFDQAATKAKVNALDAYAQHYAADSSYRSQLANAQASKYSGLANAASTNASAAANKYANSWNNLYNYYLAASGSDTSAANAIKTMLTASQGK